MTQFPYELLIGWRYTRAGRAARRNRFISFISSVSMLGIALGVAALFLKSADVHLNHVIAQRNTVARISTGRGKAALFRMGKG